MITEIKFACSHCGQRIGVGSDAAGLNVECPTCQNEVTIPDGSAPPEPRRKDAGLREKLAIAQSECERLQTAATHAQAEIKSFQNERLALRSEAASLKQRAATAESRIGAMQDDLATHTRELSENRAALEQTQIAAAIAEARVLETQSELAGISGKLAAAETQHASLLGEMDSLRALLDKDAVSRDLLATKSSLAAAEKELGERRATAAQTGADLLASEMERARLDKECGALQQRVADVLREAEDSTRDRIAAENAKLRELLERQGGELKTRFKEVARYRRAKLTLRIIWALAALGAVGLGYLFVRILPMIEWSHGAAP